MTDSPSSPEKQDAASGQPFMVVFDAPDELKHAFLREGFKRHGRQPGAWSRRLDPDSPEAGELTYELGGVGLSVKWWRPS